jgi:hypothetical protein
MVDAVVESLDSHGRTHRFMQASLEHMEQAARDSTRFVGSERQ